MDAPFMIGRLPGGVLERGDAPIWKVTRKDFAVTGAKEMVCSGAPPRGMEVTVRKLWPSSLASRSLESPCPPVATSVSARMTCGCGKVN